jgi:hypothetical protein
MKMLSLHLERIIAKAAVQDDQTLTKKTCRDKLKAALGLSTLDPTDIDFINQEISRISRLASLCVEYMHASTPVPDNESQRISFRPGASHCQVHSEVTRQLSPGHKDPGSNHMVHHPNRLVIYPKPPG